MSKLDQATGTFVSEDGDGNVAGEGFLIIAGPEPPAPTMELTHDGEALVRVWMDTGKVEVLREPEDETLRRGAEVFWEGIEVYGGTLYGRVRQLNELLTEVRDLIPGPDVMSGLRAFSRKRKEELAKRIDEVLDNNKTFLEQADHRSIFPHGEDQASGEGQDRGGD